MTPLELANCLEALVRNNRESFVKDAVTTIRKQNAEIEALRMSIELHKTKPLSDEEIKEIWWDIKDDDAYSLIYYARAIEERHGIK